MERLTEKTIGCFEYSLKNHKPIPGEFGTYEAFFDYSMAVRALGKYEDTGLTPEEITDHEEMFKAYRHVCGGKPPEEIASLRADRDYWEREAKKWCDKLFDIRAYAEKLECKDCPHEDTDKCNVCERKEK